MTKILFIHHGSHAGGAPLSMLYTMQGMKEEGYDIIAALVKPNAELHKLYNDEGFETIETPQIPIFITWSASEGKRYNPIMWKGVFNAWRKWQKAKLLLLDVVKEHKINIVHLNSVCLSNPATMLMENNIPFVWHVREYGPRHKGNRYRFISNKLQEAKEVIFLSKGEQKSWVGNKQHGTVVNNFVNFDKFNATIDKNKALESLNVSDDKNVILYVGGMKKHKGIICLLEALGELKSKGANFKCLMPDTHFDINNPSSKLETKCATIIKNNKLERNCILLPFSPDIVRLFVACDVLVFPASKPHFARPVVEGSAMSKPVIASNLPAIDELVIEGETGFLVESENSHALFERIAYIFNNPIEAKAMGEAGRKYAIDNFDSKLQMKKIVEVYNRL